MSDGSGHAHQQRLCDAVVVGGGPAGVAAALALHQHGLRVEVVERSRYGDVRLGETLPPAVQVPLAAAGLWDAFVTQRPHAGYGVRSYWGGTQPIEQAFLFNPYGNGWQVDRRLLDATFAAAARLRGIAVHTGVRATFRRNPTGPGWDVEGVGAGCGESGRAESLSWRARWLVVATGRRGRLAQTLGTAEERLDRLVAVAGFLRQTQDESSDGPAEEPVDPVVVIEAAPQGWWYSAPLPDGRMVVTFFTDADICARQRLTDPRFWGAHLSVAPATHQRAERFRLAGDLRTAAACSTRLDPPVGPHWIAVGDSAQAHDPLAGNGLGNAIDGARRGAEALLAADSGDQDALSAYAQNQAQRWRVFVGGRSAYYAIQARYPHSPFWQRRWRANDLHKSVSGPRRHGST